MRYKIKFSYDGTNFYGYQKQPGLRTVEEEFEKALTYINNHQDTKIFSSGRTDKGVHALCQVAHFDIDVSITLYKLKCALNSLLPEDIHVFSTEVVDNSFHARFLVKKKKYRYVLNLGEYNPLERNYVYQYCKNKELDITLMKKEILSFIGEHNFESFVSNEAKLDSYVRTIYDVSLYQDKDYLIFEFIGSGFMKYQVRNMVGTLLRVGEHKIDEGSIDKILNFDMDSKYVYTMKPEGLYLVDVSYE